jgi:hypothetical protein
MTNLTIAQQIIANNEDSVDRVLVAHNLATEKDQDWDNETTIFTFKDNSKMKYCYPFAVLA